LLKGDRPYLVDTYGKGFAVRMLFEFIQYILKGLPKIGDLVKFVDNPFDYDVPGKTVSAIRN
jgi:hypothetical protein